MTNGHHFFSGIDCLRGFLLYGDATSKELIAYLPKIRNRLGDDMCNGGFWIGLQSLAETHPSKALDIIEKWKSSDLTDEILTMSSCLVGTLRTISSERTRYNILEADFQSSENPKYRQIYLRSWFVTDGLSRLNTEGFQKFFEDIDVDSKIEVSEAIQFISRCLPRESRDDNTFKIAVDWLISNSQTTSSPLDQFLIIQIFHDNHVRCKDLGIDDLSIILSRLGPIKKDHLVDLEGA